MKPGYSNEVYMTEICVIQKAGTGEYEEKKSRFIASLARVETEDEAQAFIATVRKKYYDARHNCSAFVLGRNREISRCSDDGEPSGTAGRPMLEVLNGAGLTDVVAVVTRYFGGTKLGTGGLVRAYTAAMQAAVDDSELAVLRAGVEIQIQVAYSDVDKLLSYIQSKGLKVKDSEYGEKVCYQIILPEPEKERHIREITELTAGRCNIREADKCIYYENV